MIKLVINDCFGSFGLSEQALELYNEKRIASNLPICLRQTRINRSDPILVEIVQSLGRKADGKYSRLIIIEIEDIYAECYSIDEYDGKECIICDPAKVVERRLNNTNTRDMTDQECRILLNELIIIVK